MADPPPVPAASGSSSPPLANIRMVDVRTGIGTTTFISFLTQLWASTGGDGGLAQIVSGLQVTVANLINIVDGVVAQIAVIFGMHGDGTLTSSGALIVTKTDGVPFAPSATIDTTIADNIEWGLLPTLQLPWWLFKWSTIDDLPTPSPGRGILCTDLGGGPGVLTGDGQAWRRTSAGLEIQAAAATLTLAVLTNAEEQLQTAALGANMVVTLAGDNNVYFGARFRWVRAGAGAFTLAFKDQGSGTTLYTSAANATETVEFLYSGSGWVLAQHSAL